MTDADDVEDEQQAAGGFQLDALKSYLAFARRAVRKRLPLTLLVLLVGIGFTVAALRYLPRTFVCSTVMMAEGNRVLGDWQPAPFGAARNLIMSKENLEAIARDTGLAKTFYPRRPPVLRAKDDLLQALFGKWDEGVMTAIVAGTLESKLDISSDGSTMTINVSWTDGKTAAEIAEAARESFLRIEHATETSAFTEKMAILDRHATKVRQEIEQIAEQIRTQNEESAARQSKPVEVAPGSSQPPQAPSPRVSVRRSAPDAPDPEQPKRKEQLEAMRRRLADLESDRDRRLREERGKLADLRLKLAPSHPDVLTAEQRIAMLSQVPSELALLRAEVAGFEQEINQRDAMGRQGAAARNLPAVSAAAAEPLPSAITDLLGQNDVDQALVAQLSGAVTRYGVLRDQLRSGRVDIDTADAAFNSRYRVVVPVAEPFRPVKPNPLRILGAGLGAALLLALLLPILAELRTGIIVERWQIQHLQIPVLAELRLPPRPGE